MKNLLLIAITILAVGCSGKDESTTDTKPVEEKLVEVKEEAKTEETIAVAKPVEEKVLEDIKAIEIALLNYKISVYSYPTTDQGLQALLTKPADARRWNGPYLDGEITDPWGNGYVYRFPSQKGQRGPDIFSKGTDGQENTADDIGNWQMDESTTESKPEEAKINASTDSLADSIIGKVITMELDGDVNPIQFYEDGRMLMGENGSVKDFGLTYKIENNEVLVFKEEVRDGGISFSSSIPKVGDQVEWGPEEDTKRGKITKIKAADGIEGVPFEELENREFLFYHKDSTLLYQGKAHELYPNGKLKGVYTYKDGIQWGLTTRWHMNGQKEVEVNLKIGKPDGLVVEWHENGQKRLEVNYKDGKEVEGSAKYWNNKGEPVDSREEAESKK